jgi:hypothetical protein
MPYLAMIDRLRAFLRRPSAVLITAGYSFGDIHINEIIEQGLRANANAHVFALLHGPLEQYPVVRRIGYSQPSVSFLAGDAGMIDGQALPWRVRSGQELAPGAQGYVEVADGAEELRVAALQLGDFAKLGQLLRELAGTPLPVAVTPALPGLEPEEGSDGD